MYRRRDPCYGTRYIEEVELVLVSNDPERLGANLHADPPRPGQDWLYFLLYPCIQWSTLLQDYAGIDRLLFFNKIDRLLFFNKIDRLVFFNKIDRLLFFNKIDRLVFFNKIDRLLFFNKMSASSNVKSVLLR